MPVTLNFHLNTPAVQQVESSTQPGATIKISGLNEGTAFLSKDYFASQSDSGSYLADNNSTVDFVINYLVLYASSKGNGIGKITGSVNIDADGNVAVTAADVGGNAVAATVEPLGLQRTINLANPTTAGKIEYTTALYRYRIASVPNDATVVLEDARDNTILPPVAFFVTGKQYVLPVLNTVGVPNDILYTVSRENFTTATGKFTVTRTASSSNTNTVTFSTDGNEESYTWNGTSSPRVATITLESIATEYDISFAVESISESAVTATLNGSVVVPDDRNHYIIPYVNEDTPLYYTIKADQYHTINGTLLLKPDGSVEDITPQEEIDGTIAYLFDQAKAEVSVQMMPSITIIPTGENTAILPIGYLLPASFPVGLRIYGDKLSGGKMELVNNTSNDYQITGVQVTGQPTLNHNVFRTINDAVENLGIPQVHFKFSELRDIVTLANKKYPGQNFADYYSYLLYYYKNIYASPSGFDYSNISSLDELDPRDMGTIWGGNVWIEPEDFDGTQADFDAGLVYTTDGPEYKYIENDPRLAALGEKLIAEYAFNFTFDDAKAGPIPYSVSQMSEQNKGLQFLDYVSKTPENILQVGKMFDFIFPKNESITLTQIAMSSNGSYAHNGFQNNGLNFAFEITLLIKLVEPDYPYRVEYYKNSVDAANLIGDIPGRVPFTMGYKLTANDIARDIGPNWLNAMLPVGFLNGVLSGDFPVITMEYSDNVVIVLYTRLPYIPMHGNKGCRKEIRGRKIWIDNDNAGGTRPPSVEIVLLRDGEIYKTTTISSQGDGIFAFPCLIIWKNSGKKYKYQIDEMLVPDGYTKSVNGYDITNILD